jgi:hypothetical protein
VAVSGSAAPNRRQVLDAVAEILAAPGSSRIGLDGVDGVGRTAAGQPSGARATKSRGAADARADVGRTLLSTSGFSSDNRTNDG